MNITPVKVAKVLNDAYRKQSLTAQQLTAFKQNLAILFNRINDTESEEYNKNIIADFLKDTYYKGLHEINTNERKDLVIHNGPKPSDPVGVIIEAKKPGNKAEMITVQKPNAKALHELIHYYLQERIYKNNTSIKYLIATNVYDWLVFDAQDFEKIFYQNSQLLKAYKAWHDGVLVGDKTDWLYNQLLKPFIEKEEVSLNAATFNLKDALAIATNDDAADDEKLVDLYKIFSAEHLLKKSFANDSNSLNKEFYNELLHIIGLEEKKEGSKKLIDRKPEAKRNEGSLLENTITILQSRSRTAVNSADVFSVALELCINWLNRILFLKLLEGQLIQYHRGNKQYAFLNSQRIKDFDELDELFFEVLALPIDKRTASVKEKFANIPYLNSSLFEATENEQRYCYISALKDRLELPLYSSTVLKDNSGKRISGNKATLQYLFEFLDAYDFASDKASLIKEDNKTIINASVLGLIFEKINGYKDGSFFTPGFITMYMCRETLRRAVVQKFREEGGKAYQQIEDYDALKDAIEYSNKPERLKANELINSIKICDPAVGSGHFLVSALNELLAIKSDLRILCYRNGNRCSSHKITVANDELIVKNVETDQFFAYQLNQNNQPIEELQEVQEMLFHEKQTLIENCLFGVDINPKSVMICQLRLWIELLKNAYYIISSTAPSSTFPPPSGEIEGALETLPNIDINIKCGNSLISRFKLDADLSEVFQKTKRFSPQAYLITVEAYKNAKDKTAKDGLKQFLSDIKREFLSTVLNRHPYQKDLSKLRADLTALDFTDLFGLKKMTEAETAAKKKALQKQIDELEIKVEEYKNAAIYNNAFEWRFEFPEVLDGDGNYKGFDVVIGNPPYGRYLDIDAEIKKNLVSKNIYGPTGDIAEAMINLVLTGIAKSTSVFSFIIPKGLSYVKSWEKTRVQLMQSRLIEEVIDTSKSFKEAAYEMMIFIATSNHHRPLYSGYIEEGITEKFEVGRQLLTKEVFYFGFPQTYLSILEKIKRNCKPISNYCECWYGKGGMTPSINRSGNGIKVLTGKEVQKYYQKNVENKWYLDRALLSDEDIRKSEQEKVVVQDIVAHILYPKPHIKLTATIDEENQFCFNTVMCFAGNETIDNRFILGLINSKFISFYYYYFIFNQAIRTMHFMPGYADALPIPINYTGFQSPFITLVDKILSAKKANPQADTSAWEKEIDALVYQLYGLSDDEVKMAEGG